MNFLHESILLLVLLGFTLILETECRKIKHNLHTSSSKVNRMKKELTKMINYQYNDVKKESNKMLEELLHRRNEMPNYGAEHPFKHARARRPPGLWSGRDESNSAGIPTGLWGGDSKTGVSTGWWNDDLKVAGIPTGLWGGDSKRLNDGLPGLWTGDEPMNEDNGLPGLWSGDTNRRPGLWIGDAALPGLWTGDSPSDTNALPGLWSGDSLLKKSTGLPGLWSGDTANTDSPGVWGDENTTRSVEKPNDSGSRRKLSRAGLWGKRDVNTHVNDNDKVLEGIVSRLIQKDMDKLSHIHEKKNTN